MRTTLSALLSTYPSHNPPTLSILSIDAEEQPEISESYDVSAVPFLVLLKDSKVLETVSGSDASKVRNAVERHAGAPGAAKGVTTLPPPLVAGTPAPTTSKDLSGYAPPPGAPANGTGEAKTSKEELHARLSALVKAAPVMLFMKGTPSAPQCGFSRQLVGILREKGVRYGFFNILADEEVRQGLKEFADWPTFPQLWANGELVGGLDIVSTFHLLTIHMLIRVRLQVKEEIENDPGFLKEFVAGKQNGTAQAESLAA